MDNLELKKLNYCIFDPTGNITALVETEVPVAEQPAAASAVMEKHPEVEQVGFVRLLEAAAAELRMAGGEFCGNATMCTAALYAIRKEARSSTLDVTGKAADSAAENTAKNKADG